MCSPGNWATLPATPLQALDLKDRALDMPPRKGTLLPAATAYNITPSPTGACSLESTTQSLRNLSSELQEATQRQARTTRPEQYHCSSQDPRGQHRCLPGPSPPWLCEAPAGPDGEGWEQYPDKPLNCQNRQMPTSAPKPACSRAPEKVGFPQGTPSLASGAQRAGRQGCRAGEEARARSPTPAEAGLGVL